MICVNPEIISKLSSKGVLAYVAVRMAGDAVATTAALAGLVHASTSILLEGLKELEMTSPETVTRAEGKKWRCGDGGSVQVLESSLRLRDLIEDISKYWSFLSPEVPFSFTAADGMAVKAFLNEHPKWDRKMWQDALQSRARSVKTHGNASRTQDIVKWIRKLGDYAAGPLNEYGKPVEGSGNAGKAIAVEQANRAATAAYLNGTHA